MVYLFVERRTATLATKKVPLNPNYINTRAAHLALMSQLLTANVTQSGFSGSTTTYADAIAAINKATAGLTATDSLTSATKAYLNSLKSALS